MTVRRTRIRSAFTLVEAMLAAVILIIAVLGTSLFRYTTVLSAKEADRKISAAQTALLLCENWRGVKGAETYLPTVSLGAELTISETSLSDIGAGSDVIAEALDEDYSTLGVYTITSGDQDRHAVLMFKDVSDNLRSLNVTILSPRRGTSDGEDTYDLFKLTTYVAN